MPIPYDFVPVPTSEKEPWLDKPVLHNGSQIEAEKLLSGELLCTLTALTPLIVGNRRSLVGTDEGLSPAEIGKLQQALKVQSFERGKAILEPLRLSDRRVAISGTAIKGMLRQELGALLGAPMERVTEHAYTYRPNLSPSMRQGNKLQVRAAVVSGWDETTLTLKVLAEGARIAFRREGVNDRPSSPGHRTCRYFGGIDGQGLLAKAHAPGAQTYNWALVPDADLTRALFLSVPSEVLNAYLHTQDVLADDVIGHLRAHPRAAHFTSESVKDEIAASGRDARSLDTLLYVEVEVRDGVPRRILSIGHHFRYRWAYTSSVQERRAGTAQAARRAVLSPHGKEVVAPSDDGREADQLPEALTGARLLFGYVRADAPGDDDATTGIATEGIGSGIYRQLSGRIAVNMAVEELEGQDPRTDTRFLDPERECAIPLRILGQPRPSAVERYIDGNRGKLPNGREPLATYGDTLDDEGGELAGRKFYVHQPDAAKYPDLYRDDGSIGSDQATIVRYVSAPGAAFRFTLRFRDLRLHELGALLVVLDPRRLCPAPTTPDDDRNPSHALKLGYARPLGLGSVLVTVDAVNRIGSQCLLERDDALVAKAVGAFTETIRPHLRKDILERWLEIHRYRGLTRAHYAPPPTANIYTHHMDYRKNHAKRRRER